MKKSLFLLLALLIAGSGFAQKAPTAKLVSSTEEQVVVTFHLNGYNSIKVQTPQGEKVVISAPKMASMLETGAPDLPMFPIPAIIGDQAEMTVNVIDAQFTDYTNVEVAPSKGNFSRQINPEDVPYTYGEMYQQDAFWPATQAYLEAPYVLRDFRGQNIMVRPFAYNPVTKTLRVYTDMTIAMTKVSNNGENPKATRRSNTIKVDPEQKAQYGHRFINFGESAAKYTFDEDYGELLIICADQYMSNLQPLVDWKNQSGRPTTLVNVTTAGGNNIENIKNYVSSFYNDPNHNLEYILLVGEFNDITPKNYGSGSGGTCYSDNFLGKLEGNDNYLEALVGRLSVANAADADLQVNKIIYFERDVQAGASWGNKGLGIGSVYEGSGGHFGEYDNVHIDRIRDTLLHYTYTEVTDLHDGQGASTSSISNAINQGISIINYCNHGSETSWGVASYSNSNVSALTNDNMLPIIWSVACLNGKFSEGTCFAEAWLRAKNNSTNAPTGAVGGMFSYVSQPWQPPMYGQDEMVDILTEWHSADQFHHTFGGASLNGSMYVLDIAPNDAYQTFNTWLLFGDPSMMVRTDIPEAMNVSANPSVLMLGMNELNITADADYGIATLSINGDILASGEIVNGSCTLSFPSLNTVGMADLVIIGYNKVTYVGTVEIVPAEGAYITLDEFVLSNPANYGETVDMTINLKNVGVEIASNLTATVTTDCEYVTMINGEASLEDINPGEIVVIEGLQFSVAENAIDGTQANFNVSITDETNVWDANFRIILHAPAIVCENIALTPGFNSTSYVTFTFKNNGTAPFQGGQLTVVSCSPELTISPEETTFEDVVEAGETKVFQIEYAFEENVPDGYSYQVSYNLTSGLQVAEGIFCIDKGTVTEGFEEGVFGEGWTVSNQNPWQVVSGGRGNFCAKSNNNGQHSSEGYMEYTLTVYADFEMSFMYKVSSESNYDKLHFFVDGTEKGVWSGTVNWTRKSEMLAPGTHTLKWSYTKDVSVSSGEDCAWVDDVVLPPTSIVTFLTPATNLEAMVEGHNVTLTWTASEEADAYLIKRNGETLETVTETTYEDFIEEITEDEYVYSVYALNGDQISAPITTTVVFDVTGVAEDQNVNVDVYPIPASQVLTIAVDADNFNYQLINGIGQVVCKGNASHKANVNVNELSKGVYFLRIDTGSNVTTKKVVVE